MAVIQELIRVEDNKSLSFGNYLMEEKRKVLDFESEGDLYKVKTFNQITKLEKNGNLLFESVPGTTVHNFIMDGKKVEFKIEAEKSSNVTLELEADKNYKIYIDQVQVDKVKSNLAGKLTFSVDANTLGKQVVIEKI